MPDPKIIGLLAAVSLLVGYGILSIGMDHVKQEYDSNGRISDLLRPSVLPRRAMYEVPREWEKGGKKYSKRAKNRGGFGVDEFKNQTRKNLKFKYSKKV